MEQDMKKEALRQYLHYFRFWFAAAGLMLVILAVLFAVKNIAGTERGNTEAPEERVYDEADVLSDAQEEELRAYIAEQERKVGADIVLVTINEDVEQYGRWDSVMMQYADDFYDNLNYGYDRVHGDGVLLLDNWYEGQKGSWLSTCGKVYERFGDYEVNQVLDAVFYKVEENPCEAYKAYVDKTCSLLRKGAVGIPLWAVLALPAVLAAVYAGIHLKQKKAEDTTTAVTFVENGRPVMKESRDDFVRKNVVSVRIETGSRGGGRSGGHRGSSGVRHGGGGRRR